MLDHYFFSYPHGVALFWFFVGLAASSARLGKAAELVACRPATAGMD